MKNTTVSTTKSYSRLTYRRRRRVRTAQGQLPLFVEKDFDSRALLAGLYDFKTCARSDGSYYGTSDSNQCRIGTETQISSLEDMKEKGWNPEKDALNARRLNKNDAKAMSDDIMDKYEAVLEPTLGVERAKVEQAHKEYNQELERIQGQMRDGTLDPKEVEAYKVNHMVIGDVSKAEVITIGMEYGGNADGSTLSKYMAMEAVARNRGLDYIPSEVMIGGQLGKGQMLDSYLREGRIKPGDDRKTGEFKDGLRSDFFQRQAAMASTLSGKYTSPVAMEHKGVGVASLEARAVPARRVGEGAWKYGDQPWVKNNPAMMAQLGTRSTTEVFDRQRFKRVSDTILEQARDPNSKLKTVIISTGKDNSIIGDSIARDLSRAGMPVSQFTYKTGRVENVGRIIGLPNGGHVYDLGTTVSYSAGKLPIEQFQKQKLKMETGLRNGTFKSDRVTPRLSPGQVNEMKKTQKAQAQSRKQRAQAEEKAARAGARRSASPATKAPVRRASTSSNNQPKRTMNQIQKDAAKRQKELDKITKQLKQAREKRNRYADKRNGASYKKYAAQVNELATAERKLLNQGT